jgi:hypothetical protein
MVRSHCKRTTLPLPKSPTDWITWQASVTFDATQRYSVQKTLRKLKKRSQRGDTFASPDVIEDRG